MLAPRTIDEIRRLILSGNLSQRKIARRLGVSRGTVNAVALGKRPRPHDRRLERPLAAPLGPVVRCPGCGGLVHSPCLLCRVRAQQAAKVGCGPASYSVTRMR
jgi:transcriptional regulator with XRE-family HTH domain